MGKAKSLFTSKTFWFNVLAGATAIMGIVPISPEATGAVTAVINIALRALTKQPIKGME